MAHEEKVGVGRLAFYYALPMVSGGFVQFVLANYVMKYATDVLYLAPALAGSLFAVFRLYDAVTDPLCGYLSDRSSRWGRSGFIGYGGALMAAGYFLLFVIPHVVGEGGIVRAWLFGVALWVLFTGLTMLYIPHYALGAEFSAKDQARFFGSRSVAENVGTFLGVLFVAMKNEAPVQTIYHEIVFSLLVFFVVFWPIRRLGGGLRGRFVEGSFFPSLGEVLRNRAGWGVLVITFFSQLAATAMLATNLYFCEYVLGKPMMGPIVAGLFLVMATVSVPFWVGLISKEGYLRVWGGCLGLLVVGFALAWPVGRVYPSGVLYGVGSFIGFLAGALLTIHPLVLAEVSTFFDKKGRSAIYFALFTFTNKAAMATGVFFVGMVLELSGFSPGGNLSSRLEIGLRWLFAGLPLVSMLIAFGVFFVQRSISGAAHQKE
ncbi:MAG: MFS transporter [Leptospiraceae bacterium]|nr:MFS transporter [Leptospiraceae bacterium]MDW8307521.1 MFS transporter [Leptospiraceae bacterium]